MGPTGTHEPGGDAASQARRIDVVDHGRWRPEWKTNHGGRGLAVIRALRALVDAVDVVTTNTGTAATSAVVLAHIPAGAEHAPADPARRAPRGAIIRKVEPTGADADGSQRVDELEKVGIQTAMGVLLVSLPGDLDLANVDRFTSVPAQVAGQAPRALLVLLSPASSLDSQGIPALLRVGGRLAVNRRRLVLVAPQGSRVRRLLDAGSAGGVFPMFESVADVVAGSAELAT